jgi:nucleoside-diphosphate-sugar epimerase
VYTDSDWTDLSSNAGAYVSSKTLAEKAAWDFVGALPSEKRFELSTINPTFVMGPMLSSTECSSANFCKQLLLGEMAALPDMTFEMVSVFDVAKAHLLALTEPGAAGKRFLLSSTQMSIREIAALLKKEFGPQGFSPTSLIAPNFLIYTMAFFGDKLAKTIQGDLGVKRQLNPANARSILKLELKADESLPIAMTYGAIDVGIISTKDKKMKEGGFVRPLFDLSDVPVAILG